MDRQAWRDYPSVQKKMHDVCKAVLLQRHAECLLSKSSID